ncbi:SAUR-like auxin-responsive family protein [Medicago truncatula]|uniref:SAUR-like auxin-responsive family protein n=2 Tax=Medicago truncatula TaxID=3880 RepID=G7KD25_MEDTR|nr:SAUR-like auxin-responsive family protein [Medicago truncatula]
MKQSNKGHVPVLVGKKEEEEEEDMERIWVSIKVIHHPKIVELLEQSAKEYGYQQGVLRIRRDIEIFKVILANISCTSRVALSN